MDLSAILLDGLFAAIAAIGFGAVSNPPRRSFPGIALLAALGHATRYMLMTGLAMNIVFASMWAALIIGFGSAVVARPIRCPMTCLSIPALLPMIPGIYAYKTVFAMIRFMQELNTPEQGARWMESFFLNGSVTVCVVFFLAVGAVIPLFIFKKLATSMTRNHARE